MVRLGKDFIQARANGNETKIYLLNSGKRLCKIPAKLVRAWDWDQVFHPSGNLMIFQTPTDNEYLYNFDFYNPWTGNLIATISNILSIRFADDDYMFMIDDKLQLGLYRISDVIGVKPDSGFHGKVLTQFGQIKNELMPNYPNPFNPDTWIPFSLTEPSEVTIRIYDVNGHLVRAFALGQKESGDYLTKDRAICWDGRNDKGEEAGSGIYFYQIYADGFSNIKKMLLLK